jgi:prepilin-type N-terminal cleavage/methylation domain-containing protein
MRTHGARRGLTLVELVIAISLFTLLMAAVFAVMRGFIGVWDQSESRRARVEEASAVGELLANDFVQLDGGARGDLVAEWIPFDTDGDGANDTFWPRLRLVRHASEAELARLQARVAAKVPGQGLIEVVWVVVPAYKGKQEADRRSEGLVLRGERIASARDAGGDPVETGDAGERSYFDPRFFAKTGEPTPGALAEVTGGVLWFGAEFATQTTSLVDGWRVGPRLADAATSWDAWRRGRPNTEVHVWNEPGAGMPRAKQRALLPRRVKFELEFERPKEAKRRTRLAEFLPLGANTLRVEDAERLPSRADAFVKIDGEWLKLGPPSGRTVSVQRGMRGTRAANHERGARVHFGETYVREVPIHLSQEDWDL